MQNLPKEKKTNQKKKKLATDKFVERAPLRSNARLLERKVDELESLRTNLTAEKAQVAAQVAAEALGAPLYTTQADATLPEKCSEFAVLWCYFGKDCLWLHLGTVPQAKIAKKNKKKERRKSKKTTSSENSVPLKKMRL